MMKKVTIAIVAIIILAIACISSFYAGYFYVIGNQYAEECPEHADRYYIIIDDNVYEYEY